MSSNKVRISSLIAKSFHKLCSYIMNHAYTHYWLSGGRGSTKSSFISLMIVILIVQNKYFNAVILRRTENTLRTSVYAQIKWAISKLGLSQYFQFSLSPLVITYKPTGQQIMFKGAEDEEKIKGIKFTEGYAAIVWYEEVTEFKSLPQISNLNQSLLRGGDKFYVFYSYNPPESISNWTNYEAGINRPDKILHKSTYLDVPQEWLGPAFIAEAEAMKNDHPEQYRHQYLGEITGTGGEVFKNVSSIKLNNIEQMSRIRVGLDWGYASDPTAIVVADYDSKKKILTILSEYVTIGASNEIIAENIKKINPNNYLVICDCAEPKSIAYLCSCGIKATACKKYPGSVDTNYKFISQSISIRIDPSRTPNTYRELTTYELEKDRFGNFIPRYPDKNNHCLDAICYMLSDIIPGSAKPIKPFNINI